MKLKVNATSALYKATGIGLSIVASGFPIHAAEAPGASFASPIASVAALDVTVDAACLPDALSRAQGRTRFGSAFVIDARGHLVTNRHVVNGAREIGVRFADGRRFSARIVGADERTDLAVLAIKGDPAALPPPLTVRADRPPVGERVEAIGTPFGYSFSVSAGIVSGHDRVLDPLEPFGFLQHDAAINPGSSGGPLVDVQGRVVGLNTATPNGTLRDVGVALAVPAPVVKAVTEEIVREGTLRRAGIGVFGRSVDGDFAAALGRPELRGVAIESLRAGGAGETAGLRAGDIVTAGKGRDGASVPIADVNGFARWLAGHRAGDVAGLAVQRNGQPVEIAVTLEAAAQSLCGALAEGRAAPPSRAFGESGLGFADDSARIAAIAAGSPAQRAGLMPGDLVLAVGADRVTQRAAAEATLARAMGERLALLIARNGEPSRYVVLDREPDAGGESAQGNAAGGETGEL